MIQTEAVSNEIFKCFRCFEQCDNISVDETKYNLTNDHSDVAVYECECEHQYRQCLRAINSTEIVNTMAAMRKCFRYEYPIIRCDDYDIVHAFFISCSRYMLDRSQPKRHQWFNVPFYYDAEEREIYFKEISEKNF